MLHRLNSSSKRGWVDRYGAVKKNPDESEEEVQYLSPDFMDFTNKAKNIARKQTYKSLGSLAFWAFVIPLVFSVGISWIGISYHNGSKIWDKFTALSIQADRTSKITHDYQDQIHELQVEIKKLLAEMESIKESHNALNQTSTQKNVSKENQAQPPKKPQNQKIEKDSLS